MKKLNRKGFTLIELLAVITIMGILMIVAIPAISRTIENSRRDTFADTAKQYVNSVKTMWASDSLTCQSSTTDTSYSVLSSAAAGTYYIKIDTSDNTGTLPVLLESGGKSSWGSKDVKGYVKVVVSGEGSSRAVNYSIVLSDNSHGLTDYKSASSMKRSDIAVSGATYPSQPVNGLYCIEA